MGNALQRSGRTMYVKETQDFGVALVTEAGETFAAPYGSGAPTMIGMPMHAGTRAFAHWEPGDVLATNDPYSSGGMVMHLNDLYVFRPIFADGKQNPVPVIIGSNANEGTTLVDTVAPRSADNYLASAKRRFGATNHRPWNASAGNTQTRARRDLG